MLHRSSALRKLLAFSVSLELPFIDGKLEELLALRPKEDGTPVDLPMSDKTKAVWVSYYNEQGKRESEEKGPSRAAMSKLEGANARLALVIQLADEPQSFEVSIEAMEAGIVISN